MAMFENVLQLGQLGPGGALSLDVGSHLNICHLRLERPEISLFLLYQV